LSQYANPVPTQQRVPNSYYLSGKPGFWPATIPWPPIGPDVTGGDGPGGHAYRNPAHVCYDNTAKDSNGILNFNAYNCYATGSIVVDGGASDAAQADTRPADVAQADASPSDKPVADSPAAESAPISDAGKDLAVADSADVADATVATGPEPGSDSAVVPPADTPAAEPDLLTADTAVAKADAPAGDSATPRDAGGTAGNGKASGCSCAVGRSEHAPAVLFVGPLALLGLALLRRRQ